MECIKEAPIDGFGPVKHESDVYVIVKNCIEDVYVDMNVEDIIELAS